MRSGFAAKKDLGPPGDTGSLTRDHGALTVVRVRFSRRGPLPGTTRDPGHQSNDERTVRGFLRGEQHARLEDSASRAYSTSNRVVSQCWANGFVVLIANRAFRSRPKLTRPVGRTLEIWPTDAGLELYVLGASSSQQPIL
jgi:hypothetical protein